MHSGFGHHIRVKDHIHRAPIELDVLPLGQRHALFLPAPDSLQSHGQCAVAHQAISFLYTLCNPEWDRGVLDALGLAGVYVDIHPRPGGGFVLNNFAVPILPGTIGSDLVRREFPGRTVHRNDERGRKLLPRGKAESFEFSLGLDGPVAPIQDNLGRDTRLFHKLLSMVRVVEPFPQSSLVASRHLYLHLGYLRVQQNVEGAHEHVRGGSVVVAAGDRFDKVYDVSTHAACRARPMVGLVVHLERLPRPVATRVRLYRTKSYPPRIDRGEGPWAADQGRVIEDLNLLLNQSKQFAGRVGASLSLTTKGGRCECVATWVYCLRCGHPDPFSHRLLGRLA